MSFPEPVVYAFRNHLPVTRIGGDAAWVDSDANRQRDRSAELSVVETGRLNVYDSRTASTSLRTKYLLQRFHHFHT